MISQMPQKFVRNNLIYNNLKDHVIFAYNHKFSIKIVLNFVNKINSYVYFNSVNH